MRSSNVLDVDYNKEEIYEAIKKCFKDSDFIFACQNVENPYGVGNAGIKIANILAEMDVDLKKLLRKEMTIKGVKTKEGFK